MQDEKKHQKSTKTMKLNRNTRKNQEGRLENLDEGHYIY